MNAVVAAVVAVFFLVHALLGGLEGVLPLPPAPSWIIWGAAALAAFHVAASVLTSYQQLNDLERPPSARKKRHLALKWATGGFVLIAASLHVGLIGAYGPGAAQVAVSGAVAAVALVALLAVHVCVGAKSLLVDLGLDKGRMGSVRAATIALAALAAVLVVVGAVV